MAAEDLTRRQTDTVIGGLEAIASHPNTPGLAGKTAMGIANFRGGQLDASDRLHRHLDGIEARNQVRLDRSEQRLTDQDTRLRERFGDTEPAPSPAERPEA